MPAKNYKPFMTYLKPEDYERLNQLAIREARSMAAEARRAIERHLDEQEGAKKK